MDSLLLDQWDLAVDTHGNLATCGDATGDAGYRLAQDVATRCLAWRGEVYYDTTQGVRYESIMGAPPNLAMIQHAIEQEAVRVPECNTALAAFEFEDRRVTGRVTVSTATSVAGIVDFTLL